MNTARTLILSLVLLSSIYSHSSIALSCGDAVTSNVTLTADLNCTSGYRALEVFANNITINLNGFTLSGSSDLAGIYVSGYNNVTIRNGSIRGFWAGINTGRSDGLRVHSVTFYEVGSGVIVSQGNSSNIYDNDFIKTTSQAVYITNRSSALTASNHTINNNEFYRARIGIEICGDRADRNTLTNNLIWKSPDWGIHLNHSDRNVLNNNRVLETGGAALRMNNSSYNRVEGNSFREGGHTGISLLAQAGDACLDSGPNASYKNLIRRNHAIGFSTGAVIGLGVNNLGNVVKNYIVENKLYDNDTGIFFNRDAHYNNATGNAYQGTTTPISDIGVANSY